MTLNYSQTQENLKALVENYYALSASRREEITESGVVHQFVTPLFKLLGWPIDDPERFKYELNTYAGRPDMVLFPEIGGTLYIEAKRFGVIKPLEVARKTIAGIVTPGEMTLPGMAADRTREEQQAINYAFENGGTWAILTNFERLRLFNARRDWLVLSFENPRAYLDEFDQLWQLSYPSILQGSLNDLNHQRYREDVDTDYLSFINEWREVLAQDIVAQPQANPWTRDAAGNLQLDALRAVVQRVLDRLVVIRFAEDHLVIPGGTLYSFYNLCTTNPYTFTLTEFFQRLYRRFDEIHNSALFAPHQADQAIFSNAVLVGLVEQLYAARYRAMSPDIMGNTYEQYLGKTLVQQNGAVVTSDNLETRKKQGSYYTPQVIVRYLVDQSLGRYLYGTEDGHPPTDPRAAAHKTAADVRELRILDPSCGSGSFLIYAYEVLADFYRREIRRLEAACQAELDALSPTATRMEHLDLRIKLAALENHITQLQDYPRLILETHLYGVDLDPQAAEIATVNLMMRAVATQQRDRRGHKRLPLILNQNIKVGNSLVGAGPADPRLPDHAAALAELARLRRTLTAAPDSPDHAADLHTLHTRTAQLAAALDTPAAAALTPFHWPVEFPEVFTAETPGFTIIIGNPPWEIVKPDLREFYAQFDPAIESKLTRAQTEARIQELDAADPRRAAQWAAQKARIEAAAAYYKTCDAYTRQGRGDTATHKLFLERAYNLLQSGGRLGFVIPSGIYTDLGTKDLREMLLNEGNIQYLYSFSNERWFFQGVHHAFKFALLGVQKGESSEGFWATFRFNPRVAVAPDELLEFLADETNLVYVRRKSLARFSPDSLSVMEFQTQTDYNVTERIYDKHPLIGEQIDSQWNVKLGTEFHMTSARHLFNRDELGVPLYEGKMIHQFDAYFSEPRFWIAEKDLRYSQIRLGIRAIAASTNERTLISAMLPAKVGAGNSVLTISEEIAFPHSLYLMSALNSFVLDYTLRMKVTSNINMFYLYQLPVPRLTPGNPYFDALVPRAARLTCTTAAFAPLWETVIGTPWSLDQAAVAPADRQTLRDELDALIAHLYHLSRADFAHILSTFPLVFPAGPAGDAKKAALLRVYDHFAATTQAWSRHT